MAMGPEIDAELYGAAWRWNTFQLVIPSELEHYQNLCIWISTLFFSLIGSTLFSLPLFFNLFNTFMKIKRFACRIIKSCWYFQVQHLDEVITLPMDLYTSWSLTVPHGSTSEESPRLLLHWTPPVKSLWSYFILNCWPRALMVQYFVFRCHSIFSPKRQNLKNIGLERIQNSQDVQLYLFKEDTFKPNNLHYI